MLARKLKQMAKSIVTGALKIFPIQKKKIVFLNFNGRGYGCNPKYIAENILAQKLDFDLVWLVTDCNEPMPEAIRKVRTGTLRAYYELATAGVWIDNVRNSKGITKRKGQFYIQTWHGAYGVKTAEKAAKTVLDPVYVRDAKYDSSITDLFISGSKIQTQNIRENYWYENEILESGFPRDDLFYDYLQKPQIADEMKEKIGLPKDCRFILYAPTFKDDHSTDGFIVDFTELLEAYTKRFGGKWVVLFRMHPFLRNILKPTAKEAGSVLDVSDYSDMQELMLVSDVLITDYSSSMFEFMLLERPIFIYATDVQEQLEKGRIRDLYFSLPFPKAETYPALLDCVLQYDTAEHAEAMEAFKQNYSPYFSGNAAAKVVERIIQFANAHQ